MSLNLHSRDRGSDPVDDYIDVLFGVKAGRLDDHAGSAHDRPAWRQGDSLVFTYDGRERSGQWWSEEPGCGIAVYGWADGRAYWIASDAIRPETDRERHARERDGYYAEDLAR
jgi:hypothetical protein